MVIVADDGAPEGLDAARAECILAEQEIELVAQLHVAKYEQPTPCLSICGLKANSIIIPEEREAMYDQLFLVYDLDESGLIDSHEEIHALFTNTWFKCRSDSDIHLPASQASQYMATLDQVLVNGHRGFTQHEWAQWFESNVYLQHQVVDL